MKINCSRPLLFLVLLLVTPAVTQAADTIHNSKQLFFEIVEDGEPTDGRVLVNFCARDTGGNQEIRGPRVKSFTSTQTKLRSILSYIRSPLRPLTGRSGISKLTRTGFPSR